MQEKDLGKDRLDFDEFCSKVEAEIQKRLGESVRVTVHEVIKNNSLKLRGLGILKKGHNMTPTVYLDSQYEEYKDGKSLTDIADTIIDAYSDEGMSLHVDVGFFEEWELVKSRIFFELINYEKNQELLLEVPHKRFLDLAVVYYVSVEEMKNGHATILIYNTNMDMWGKTADELHKEACKNTPKDRPCTIMDMTSVMEELFTKEEAEKEKGFMYIMTNNLNFFGASTMFYPDVLKNFAEKMGKDFFILPSSVHEVLLLPDDGTNPEMLAGMVSEVNQHEVTQEEFLSDSVYRFERKTGEISIAVEGGFFYE